MFEGGCECGRCRYRVDGEILELSHCHCGMCRRMHGAAYASYAGVAAGAFRWLRGAEQLAAYASSPGVRRTFCARCGANLQALYAANPAMLYLAMGTVEGNPEHPEPFHIFVGSKAAWHTITDGHAQYHEWRDGP
jgi:hypothetical protein